MVADGARNAVGHTPSQQDEGVGVFLVEFLLPLSDNHGAPIARPEFDRVRQELTERFGGVTAFMRSPAVGLWADAGGEVRRDELVTIEVMAETLDRVWWRDYREQLKTRFCQQEIAMRSIECERL